MISISYFFPNHSHGQEEENSEEGCEEAGEEDGEEGCEEAGRPQGEEDGEEKEVNQ